MEELWIHDQLRNLGRKIVTDGSFKNIVNCTRLWMPEDALEVLQQNETRNSLKVLDLRCCDGLIKTPDFSKYSSLERLILEECTNLVEIDPSIDINTVKLRQRIGRPMKLVFLNFGSCEGLEKLLDSLGNRRSLAELDLSETRITELPDTIRNLREIRMIGIKIKELPSSSGMLKRLEVLDARWCKSLAEIPSKIEGHTYLRVLNLKNTHVCQFPPELPTSLTVIVH
ncbi:hypothetical protein CRG98_002405 [Punica granatum]|uniref:Uncharacterized protein n=1 Tax=Punica granatum TaxID=22663 RepID=A0A2I0L924_PUNGR|nr:hypothetical protein CRG98_002405 [Punica granatum]